MFGLDPLSMAAGFILASGAPMCPDHPPTRINVVPRTADVDYDYSQSLKDIQSYSTDTIDPYAFNGTTITQGFMKGKIDMQHKVWLKQASLPRYKAACVWYDQIVVEISIDPTIVIANELYKDPCMRKAVLEHELKHVKVDREIVNKYAREMGNKLMSELKSRGFTTGPFPIEHLQEVSNKMDTVVKQLLALQYEKMSVERKERQGNVDNLEEYTSVNDECPDFEKNKEKLYHKWLE